MNEAAEIRDRPRLHFSPAKGWINDPHGVVHANGRYHLFFQANPADVVWSVGVCWGHAMSSDLFSWAEEPLALSPLPDETGCWTGALVQAPAGPVILYTSVMGAGADLGIGRIALAHGDDPLTTWRRDERRFVVSVPPEVDGDAVHSFRDPFVWQRDGRWTMVVGAGLVSAGGAALQLRSDDLVTWTYDGVVADASSVGAGLIFEGEPVRLGSTWECPQLFELDGSWVLLVSVWDDGELCYVAAGVGDYDGLRFSARSWERFSHGDLLYAATAFLDSEGRRCVMSWLRELPGDRPPGWTWAGSISLPYVLRLDRDRVVAAVHPGIARVTVPHRHMRRRVTLDGDAELRLPLADGAPDGAGCVVLRSDSVTVVGARGQPLGSARLDGSGAYDVSVVVDGEVVEVTASSMRGMLAVRLGGPAIRAAVDV